MRLLVPLVSMAGVILLIVAVFRARRNEDATPIVRITLVISAAWAGIALLWGIVRAVLWFRPGVGVPFDVRTLPYWPLPAGADTFPLSGGFTTAQFTAIDVLSTQVRSVLAAADLVGTLITVALAGLVAIACFRFIQGRPFAPEVASLSLIAAVVVLVGGLSGQVLQQYGGTRAMAEIIAAGLGEPGPQAAGLFSIDWWPVWLAIGLGAFAALMRYGRTLQRDTEGLV
ncbi:hypothetical protein ET475_08495 [Microbacterium protaetiae]|uniref:DUF2975 domain-containing protein n=1 Tax=Microbacterium protaetiae TaxID=2509458 RepID=A0A4P6ECR7_9MICO|nr:hypothetical protein [Microbacterium protaetiae]QAY60025.1 hypothetical protein ET475_08495 [Microbacterium protaetiae]